MIGGHARSEFSHNEETFSDFKLARQVYSLSLKQISFGGHIMTLLDSNSGEMTGNKGGHLNPLAKGVPQILSYLKSIKNC